ncbi:hypothetical protein HJG60_007940 [Phyllostomus discolor]|uniref:Uncharacterized protein n=1 Tax=Phyllostomus discolor TaxID=89673 RepID=A0A834BL02_9CHIR|nr:hypothetical protein HJG60_007940 [Phyllostomus discolor]
MCIKDKSTAFITSVWISVFCKTSSIPSSCFFGIWGFFVGFYSVLVLAPHNREYSLYHGTDVQINSTVCFFHTLPASCLLSFLLHKWDTLFTLLYNFIHFFFNNVKINLTIMLNQKYLFPSLFLTLPPRKL